MRLIVNYGPRTAIVVLDGGATMFDLVEKCAQKVGMKNGQFDVCLDVAGRPVIEDIGDSLRLVTKEEGAPHKKQRTTSASSTREGMGSRQKNTCSRKNGVRACPST